MEEVDSLDASASFTVWKIAIGASFVRGWLNSRVGLDAAEKGNIVFYADNRTPIL
jgi:hypothetical protein